MGWPDHPQKATKKKKKVLAYGGGWTTPLAGLGAAEPPLGGGSATHAFSLSFFSF